MEEGGLGFEEAPQSMLDGSNGLPDDDSGGGNILEEIPGLGALSTRGGTFRCQGTRFAITFSKCEYPPQQAFESIVSSQRTILNFVYVVQQEHIDGKHHLHICIEYNQKQSTRNCFFFDWIVESHIPADYNKHANFGVVKSMPGWVSYIHDPQKRIAGYHWPPSLNIEEYVAALRLGKSKKLDVICAKIMDGELTIDELKYCNPGIWIHYHDRLERWLEAIKDDDRTYALLEWKQLAHVRNNRETNDIIDWLNQNIKQPRHRKQKQLWITSPPDYNKGRLVDDFLGQYLRICYASQCEDFLDGYADGKYDLIVFDDVQPKIWHAAYLSKILEGGVCRVKIKGKQVIKRDCLPVIITSNFAMEQLFPNVTECAQVRCRVQYKCLSRELPVTYEHQ